MRIGRHASRRTGNVGSATFEGMSVTDLLLALATLFVGALMFTGQVPPKQAISNIAAWWFKPFGLRVRWLEDPDADRIIRNIAWVAVPLLLAWGGFQYLDVQNMREGPKTLLTVGALCLVGGIGWHIFGPPLRAKSPLAHDPVPPAATSSNPAPVHAAPRQSSVPTTPAAVPAVPAELAGPNLSVRTPDRPRFDALTELWESLFATEKAFEADQRRLDQGWMEQIQSPGSFESYAEQLDQFRSKMTSIEPALREILKRRGFSDLDGLTDWKPPSIDREAASWAQFVRQIQHHPDVQQRSASDLNAHMLGSPARLAFSKALYAFAQWINGAQAAVRKRRSEVE